MAQNSGSHREDEAARRAREQELQKWREERQALKALRGAWLKEHLEWAKARDAWAKERGSWIKERTALAKERVAWKEMRESWEKDHRARENELRREQTAAATLDEEAARRTRKAKKDVAALRGLLKDSLGHDPRIDLATRRREVRTSPFEPGDLEEPSPAPSPERLPDPPAFGGMFQRRQRHEAEVEARRAAYAQELEEHRRKEAERQQRIAELQRAHDERAAREAREVAEENARIERMIAGLRDGDHDAVGGHLTMVLRESPYPPGFPVGGEAVHRPGSSLLTVGKPLPTIEVVPHYGNFRHIRDRKAVEGTPRPKSEARKIYQGIIAQIALRTLREIFAADTAGHVTTVVFNGLVRTVDAATGQSGEVCLIALRATREQFAALVLGEPGLDPVKCVRRHFSAALSADPQKPVEPLPSE